MRAALVLTVWVAFCAIATAQGATWYVDDSVSSSGNGESWDAAFKTIQEGIDRGSDGDAVIVAEGTYVENIHFHGKNIVLRSKDPTDPAVVSNTIIDSAKGAGCVITFSGTEGHTCLFSGFTVRKGSGENGGGVCGGTRESRTRASIENNIITGNSADRGGGLAYCDGTIRSNTISANSAEWGGGLAWCNAMIEGNTVTGNSARWGGGFAECDGVIQNNVIRGNSAIAGGGTAYSGGGGLALCDGAILGNEVSGNSATNWGGGLFICSGTVVSNTIVRNSAGNMGGGLKTCDAIVRNSIIWGNSAPTGAQIFEAPLPAFCCVQGGAGGGEGNIQDDPAFVDFAGGDYRLSGNSPCIDTGKNEDWMWQAVDLDGDPRVLNRKVDMGAHERGQMPIGETWFVDNSVSESGDGTSWDTAKRSIQEAINAASSSDTVMVAEGIYFENIALGGKNIVVRSSDILGRKAVSTTVIDGNKAGSVVTFSGTEDETCVLSGFTIRDGKAANGAGILGGSQKNPTHARIENNIISGNSADNGGGLAYCAGPVLNNTIAGNSAGMDGAALYYCNGTIRNCIIWGNAGGNQIDQHSSTPTYSCLGGWTHGGEGNIGRHPYFVAAGSGDCRLLSWSPCIDNGDVVSPFSQEPAPNGERVDMGAYGNTTEATSKSPDTDRDGLPDDWETEFFGHLGWGKTDDLDRDLISNLQEYYRGSDPVAGPSRAGTRWYVDGSMKASGDGKSWETAFKTVQEGIIAAEDGDTVTVASGTYVENITLNGKNITLCSTDPLNAAIVSNTTLDGGQSGSVVAFSGTEQETCVLAGFTIRNGNPEYGGGICGGTPQGLYTHATICNNVITGNSARRGGGLAFCDGVVRDNVIAENTSERGGGLIYCNGVIRGNTISDNAVAGPASAGGGICECEGIVRENVIIANSATGEAGNGGGLGYCRDATIWNNLISGNRAVGVRTTGGGVCQCHGIVENNTIVSNSAGWSGGGLSFCDSTMSNCVFWANTASSGPQVYDSRDPVYSCVQGWSGGGQGNISGNPQFADVAGNDYRLSENSPCIDTGVNKDWMWDAADLDGNPRVWPGKTTKPSLTVDMGAYEYGSFPFKITEVFEAAGGQLTWTSRPGDNYTIWSRTDLAADAWTEEAAVASQGDATSWTDPSPTASQKFYRVGLQ